MHQPVLLEYFRSGLTGVRSEVQKKLADEESQKTGLTYQQIKVSVCSLCLAMLAVKQGELK